MTNVPRQLGRVAQGWITGVQESERLDEADNGTVIRRARRDERKGYISGRKKKKKKKNCPHRHVRAL